MTPNLAAKAREIAGRAVMDGWSTWGPETWVNVIAKAIESALTDADAAATERAAKVVEAKWGRFGPRVTEHLAAAIRNQEKPDADA